MPSSSSRPQAGTRTSVTYRDNDGQRHRRVFANQHLADQFQQGHAASQSPSPTVTAAPPAHHRSIHPLRQLARMLIDGSPAGLSLTFLPALDTDDIEQDWPVPPTEAQRHLIFRQPR